MSRLVDLDNPRIIHIGRDKFGNGIYHIPPELPTKLHEVKPMPLYESWLNADGVPVKTIQIGFACPNCHTRVEKKYCPECGAEINWGEYNRCD